jgi:O-antigen biosynthesis protein
MRGEASRPFGAHAKHADCAGQALKRTRRLEWRLSERGRLLAAEAEHRAAAEASAGAAGQERLEALHALRQMRSSTSWRITAPLRALGHCCRALIDFLRPPRIYRFRLTPNPAVVERSGGYVCTGADPQLSLIPVDARFPHGWTVLRYRVGRATTVLLPRLYADLGWGYAEANSWALAPARNGKVARAIHLSARPTALRLGLGADSLEFELSGFEAESGGLLWLALLVLRHAIRNSKRVPLLRRSVGAAARCFAFGDWGGLVRKLKRRSALFGEESSDYERWLRLYDRPDAAARWALADRQMSRPPLISVLMPVYDPPANLLAAAMDSVKHQSYESWELCIADDGSASAEVRQLLRSEAAHDSRIKLTRLERNRGVAAASNAALALAQGHYVALLDHDDELAPHALAIVAGEIAASPETELLYSDEDKIDLNGRRYDPYFKPDWNPDLFYAQNYLNHLCVYRRSGVLALGGFREGLEGSQDYDLALRLIEHVPASRIRHVARVLYHWRAAEGSTARTASAKPLAHARSLKALREHFARLGVEAEVSSTLGIYHRVRWPLPAEPPLVSLIIPTRNGVDMLRRCVEGIRHRTAYARWELIIIDNGSDEKETLDYLGQLASDSRIRVVEEDRPFNYASLNNRAATLARGSILGFLNNDLAVIGSDWLTEMVSQSLRDGIGAVGARLLYPDGLVQHAGVVLGIGGVAGHLHRFARRDDGGHFGRAQLVQDFSAVTAACMLVPKPVFEMVGGFDATNLPVAFNDVDLCLRIADKGYRIVWTPHATLYHFESASRGYEDTPQKRARFRSECGYMRARWGDRLLNDPCFNPNLSLDSELPALAFPPRVPSPHASKSARPARGASAAVWAAEDSG